MITDLSHNPYFFSDGYVPRSKIPISVSHLIRSYTPPVLVRINRIPIKYDRYSVGLHRNPRARKPTDFDPKTNHIMSDWNPTDSPIGFCQYPIEFWPVHSRIWQQPIAFVTIFHASLFLYQRQIGIRKNIYIDESATNRRLLMSHLKNWFRQM